MKFELRPARPADVKAIMQVMADAMANLQHPEWFVPDDAVYMAEHISGPKGFCLVAEEKTTGALAAYFTVKLAGTAPDALGWQLGMSRRAEHHRPDGQLLRGPALSGQWTGG